MLTRSLLLAAFLGVPAAAQQPAVPSCPHGAADDEATMVSVVVAGDPVALHLVIDSVLTDLHYRLSTAESSLDQWVTQSKFGWPDGSELAGKAGAPDPGVQVIVDLEPDTGGTMVAVPLSAPSATRCSRSSTGPRLLRARLTSKC